MEPRQIIVWTQKELHKTGFFIVVDKKSYWYGSMCIPVKIGEKSTIVARVFDNEHRCFNNEDLMYCCCYN